MQSGTTNPSSTFSRGRNNSTFKIPSTNPTIAAPTPREKQILIWKTNSHKPEISLNTEPMKPTALHKHLGRLSLLRRSILKIKSQQIDRPTIRQAQFQQQITAEERVFCPWYLPSRTEPTRLSKNVKIPKKRKTDPNQVSKEVRHKTSPEAK